MPELIHTKANQSTFNRECWSADATALTLMAVLVFVEVIVFAERKAKPLEGEALSRFKIFA